MINTVRFAGHLVSVATTHLCGCGVNAARDDAEAKGGGCVFVKGELQKEMMGQAWPQAGP